MSGGFEVEKRTEGAWFDRQLYGEVFGSLRPSVRVAFGWVLLVGAGRDASGTKACRRLYGL